MEVPVFKGKDGEIYCTDDEVEIIQEILDKEFDHLMEAIKEQLPKRLREMAKKKMANRQTYLYARLTNIEQVLVQIEKNTRNGGHT